MTRGTTPQGPGFSGKVERLVRSPIKGLDFTDQPLRAAELKKGLLHGLRNLSVPILILLGNVQDLAHDTSPSRTELPEGGEGNDGGPPAAGAVAAAAAPVVHAGGAGAWLVAVLAAELARPAGRCTRRRRSS